ncbi:MAG: hypothetical protein IPL84_00555 [Chitinophagaceae bacterium]|nr:hypothetical protein [Chitinophagaceae bacterium]
MKTATKGKNSEDNDTLNPMATVRNYGAGTEAAHLNRLDDDDEEVKKEADLPTNDSQLPDEATWPEEAADDEKA